MFSNVKFPGLALCVLTTTCLVEAQSPTLSISSVSPDILQFSWPSNFTAAAWQLTSTTNLASAIWQPVPLTPFPSNTALVVFLPVTDLARYFRLQQISAGLGSCVFQATPPVIDTGQSSTLTWCPQAGYTYWLSPGPGTGGPQIVTGGSISVSPTSTTVYTLTASNILGVARADTATVICNLCGWVHVADLNAELTFHYYFASSTSSYNFSVNQLAGVTFHLHRLAGSTDTDAYFFGFTTADPVFGITLDSTFIQDREDDKTGTRVFTTTEAGKGPSVHNVSTLSLHVTCTSLDFSFNVLADTMEISDFGTTHSPDGVGTGQVTARPIETVYNSIRGVAYLPAAYPPNGGDYFVPSSDVGKRMFTSGTVSAPNAGQVLLTWSFYPPP